MAVAYSPHLNLELPDQTEEDPMAFINGNMELIDEALYSVNHVGVEHAGKFMMVNQNGDIVPVSV